MRAARFVVRLAGSFPIALVALGGAAAGDCLSDCSAAYEAAVSSCQDRFGAAGQEPQLQQCMDAAQADYGRCNDACETSD